MEASSQESTDFLFDDCTPASQLHLQLESPDPFGDDTDSDEDCVEFPVIPLIYLDTRRYLYSNGVGISEGTVKIKEIKASFGAKNIMNLNLKVCNVAGSNSNLQLLASFAGASTITRVGVRGKIEYSDQLSTSIKLKVQLRRGDIANCSATSKIYENHFFPRPSSTVAYFDHGKALRAVARDGFNLELNTTGHGMWALTDCTVFIRVHIGIIPDKKFDGEDLVTRRLTWK